MRCCSRLDVNGVVVNPTDASSDPATSSLCSSMKPPLLLLCILRCSPSANSGCAKLKPSHSSALLCRVLDVSLSRAAAGFDGGSAKLDAVTKEWTAFTKVGPC